MSPTPDEKLGTDRIRRDIENVAAHVAKIENAEHQRPAEEGPYEPYVELEVANDNAISPKVGVPTFVGAVYAAILATLAWQNVTVPLEVAGAWGAVITIASGWLAPRG